MMTFGFAMCNIVRSGGNEIRKYECIVASRESTPFTRCHSCSLDINGVKRRASLSGN